MSAQTSDEELKRLREELVQATVSPRQAWVEELKAAAKDLLGTLHKLIDADEVAVIGTDLGAEALRERLERLEAALRGEEVEL